MAKDKKDDLKVSSAEEDMLHEENGSSEEVDDRASSEEKIDQCKQELEEMRDKYLRLFAEFDNFKKRSLKEKIEMSKRAGAEVLLALLPVLDDFDRAKKNAEDPENEEYFSEGVELVYQKFQQILKQQGLTPMDTEDREFNPEFHDAIADVPVEDEAMKGKIIDFIEKGYMLNDRILRHAKVVVGKR